MPRPPTPAQRRYRGRVRNTMRSAVNHLTRLLKLDIKLRAGPLAAYPNQLAPATEISVINSAYTLLFGYLADKGPIPSR
jgi:hypothetical protein